MIEQKTLFPVRDDRYGQRVVYLIDKENKSGECAFKCTGCNVRQSLQGTPESNIRLLKDIHKGYDSQLTSAVHVLIYNNGNITNPEECSRKTLRGALDFFAGDERIKVVSISSRGHFLTDDVLNEIGEKKLPYQINIIYGQESFSENLTEVYGKKTTTTSQTGGELECIVEKITKANNQFSKENQIVFGLEVNLLYLTEFYKGKKIQSLQDDVKNLLRIVNGTVPLEIDINPYQEVPHLPYQSADIQELLEILPELQIMVDEYNKKYRQNTATIFVGLLSPDGSADEKLQRTADEVNNFNKKSAREGDLK